MATVTSRAGLPATLPGAAALYDLVLALGERKTMRSLRDSAVGCARGRTLEIGAGTGLNVPYYPPSVTDLVFTEPEPAMARRLRRRAVAAAAGAGSGAGAGVRAEVVEAGAEALPFADDAFDTAVSTMVLCTVSDPEAALAELRRVLRPGGSLLFIEHVRADEPRAARRQRRLERPWAVFAGGCRCTRDTLTFLGRHFEVTELARHRWRGMPGIVQPLIAGRAVVPA
jgi:SAM-dependent methyltransferase